MSNSRRSLESDYECHPISIEKLSASNPSGISLLLQQEHEQQEKNDQENKPINAFVVTSRPSITYTQSDSMLSDSYRSPSCYGDNTGQKKSDWQADSQSYSMSVPYGDDDMMHSYVDTYTLSRTPSSNFYDNQSDYEVILDDGTRQKRTVSLTTVQLVPSQQQDDRTINTEDIPETQTNDRRLVNESTPLLESHAKEKCSPLNTPSFSDYEDEIGAEESDSELYKQNSISTCRRWGKRLTKFRKQHLVLSLKQKMVLKCSLAYMIGSLFTFVPQLNALCGSQVASHMASTVTVFFLPSKTVGSMIEAAGFGWLYTIAALAICLASMATSDYLLDYDMPITASAISLGFWLAGSVFVISYLKAKLNKPNIFTGSALAFIILFSVIVREGSFNRAEFNISIIYETFSIVAIGNIISVAICIFIWPMTATQKLRENIDSSLSSTRVLLKLLTKTFLLDTDLPDFTANTTLKKAIMAHRTSFTTLNATLNDAKLEFFSLEMTKHSDGYEKIVKSLQRLAQHVGGLRSSCGLQVQVMQSSNTNDKNSSYGVIPNIKTMTHSRSKNQRVYNLKGDSQRKKMENEMKHERILEGLNKFKDSNSFEYDPLSLASNNSDIDKRKEGALVQFIRTVRSPMKSLAYTCKQTIIHLQTRFRGETKLSTPSFELMRQNLLDAIKLFEESQHQALIRFYKRKIKKEDQQKEPKYDEMHSHLIKKFPTDDIFLVYFFVFCLLEFAKELMILVDNVQLVYDNVDELDKTSNVIVWFKHLFLKVKHFSTKKKVEVDFIPNNNNTMNTLHTPTPTTKWRKFFLKLWGFFSEFRTYRVRFAIKSTLMAEAISSLAFIPATRPYFTEFKMEWTLITVMAVMLPTVGGTNLGAILRIFSTILGCVLAAIIYTLFESNTFMLWLMTWLISIPSFWMIQNHKHGRFGLFTLLAYNLIVLYKFNNRFDDSVDVFELTWMRCVAVCLGVVLGLIATAYVWPYEARAEVRKGLSDLLLRLSWLYKQLVSVYSEDEESEILLRTSSSQSIALSFNNLKNTSLTDELSVLSRRNKLRAANLQKIEMSIQLGLFDLQGLLVLAPNEPRLKGPFPAKTYSAMLNSCQNILDKFLSMRIVILKDVWAIHARKNFLSPAAHEFMEMAGNVFLYFYILASALQLKTPLPPYLPPAEKTRQLLMKKLRKIPLIMKENMMDQEIAEEKKDECYMVYYAYVVLMETIISELEELGNHMKDLFGSLVPDHQWATYFGQRYDIEANSIPNKP